MRSIDPAPGKIKELINDIPLDKPILMLNLLRFNKIAKYPENSEHNVCSGEEAYNIYSKLSFPKIRAAGGGMYLQTQVLASVIAPEDEEWDKAFIVSWPSLQTFLDVIMDQNYQEGTVHRTAALEDSRLLMLDSHQVQK